MYATITSGTIIYLGESEKEATLATKANPSSCSVVKVNNLQELVLAVNPITAERDDLSDAFEKITHKLNELGINKDLADKFKNNGEKLVGEAKSLGARGIKSVGSGFIALGDLLNKIGAEEQKNEDIKDSPNKDYVDKTN